jgi:putative spermidine/putrescine transport system permease protein
VATIVFLLSPMIVVAAASFDASEFFTFPPSDLSVRWFEALVDDDRWRASLSLSLQIAALSAAASTIVGGLAGLALARVARSVRLVLLPVVLAPLVIPAIVLAISFYRVVLEVDLVGRVGTFAAANTLLSAPLVAILVAGAAMRIDPRLEFASLSCGASRTRTLTRITAPLILPTALAGGVFAFIFAMGEVVLSIFLVAPDRTPLAVRMFLEARQGPAPLVTAASTTLIVASLFVVVIGSLIGGKEVARGVRQP